MTPGYLPWRCPDARRDSPSLPSPAMVTVEPLDTGRLADLDELFACDESVNRCWCMWFIIRVKDYQAAGRDGNRAAFVELVEQGPSPMGLIAYDDGTPVGWCAAGPRSRYERAVKTPTLADRDPAEHESVWLVPCFFIRPGRRQQGVAGGIAGGRRRPGHRVRRVCDRGLPAGR